MTEEDLAVIEARANAATPAPWIVDVHEDGQYTHPDEIRHPDIRKPIVETDCGAYGPSLADAQFIGHAREDVPALIAEVRALKAHLASHGCTSSDCD